jgi:hypothetical protein
MTGGTLGSAGFGDVWYWNGSDWSRQVSQADTQGSASIHDGLAFDGITDVLYTHVGTPDATTFTWSGAEFQPEGTQASGPELRQYPAMAYDPGHQDAVLFGGEGGNNQTTAFSDTWVWSAPETASPAPTHHPTPQPVAVPSPTPSPDPTPSPIPSPSPTPSQTATVPINHDNGTGPPAILWVGALLAAITLGVLAFFNRSWLAAVLSSRLRQSPL